MCKLSFLFLSANTPWVYALANNLAKQYSTIATRFFDWRTYNRLQAIWPSSTPSPLLQRSINVLPPGYTGNFECLFRGTLQSRVTNWCEVLREASGEHPWVIAPYPYLAPWVRRIPSEKLIYYNLDDYTLYKPSRKSRILALETELLERSALTLCLARFQAEKFQKWFPGKARSIYHFPLGVMEKYLNPHVQESPEQMTVGYIGNLVDRVDWQLVYSVARACSEIKFIFVGGLENSRSPVEKTWQTYREATLALPNTRHINKVSQEQVAQYYWFFAVTWIPYDIAHPFNQASCPTKIMDGIASGRPVLSTDIPECRLYSEWITIFYSIEQAIILIRKKLGRYGKGNSDSASKNAKQLEFAKKQTWGNRVKYFEDVILKTYDN